MACYGLTTLALPATLPAALPALLAVLTLTLPGVHSAVIQVFPDPDTTLTCWSCPEHPDNEACNNWAPDIFCPLHRTWCMSVNRVDMVTGESVAVYKRCAEEQECDVDNIGCYESTIPGVLECKTCCNEDYCNEAVPYNTTSALELSGFYSSSASGSTYRQSAVLLLATLLGFLHAFVTLTRC